MDLTVVIPARNEADCIAGTVTALAAVLSQSNAAYEIIVVDDGSTDGTWENIPGTARAIYNHGPSGFGRAVALGIQEARGEVVVIYMADASDSPQDVVRYWHLLEESGCDAVFGSRFLAGGSIEDYPLPKLMVNRLANLFIRLLFNVPFDDFTNAFKAYRRSALEGCMPLLSPHFNLTVELPLKIIARGYRWTTMPISWRNRRAGESKLKIKEMGSRYLFICLYLWLEKHLSRGDYRRQG